MLLFALRTVSAGGRSFSPKLNQHLYRSELGSMPTLSAREIEVCERRRKNRIKPTILKSDGGLGVGDYGRCDFRKGGWLSAFDAVFHAVAGAFD
jgi:hypothetical protein